MATPTIRIEICSEAASKQSHPDENSYLTSSCNPRKHWIIATLWDPVIPDPAFDRHFASYWMDQLQSESSIHKNGNYCLIFYSFLEQNYYDATLHLTFLPACPQFMMAFILGSQESRSMLRRLDRVIGFPEEGALMLRDFEHALFGGTNVKQLLQGLVKNLAKRKGQSSHRKKEQNVLHFHRIVAHFYLVS